MITGDIGCYTLGVSDPYDAMDVAVDMGSAFAVGHGAQTIFNMGETKKRVIAVQGDSTFFHTGINGLINSVYNKDNTINVILDNRVTGMTGHQENPGTGYTLQLEPTDIVDIETLARACGVKHIIKVNPNDMDKMRNAFKQALLLDEPSVIITRWPCALKKFSKEDKQEFKNLFTEKYRVNGEMCIGCKQCTKTGCPAISFNNNYKVSKISMDQCVGCGVCEQVCPAQAIGKVER